jgi:hypothetical protein
VFDVWKLARLAPRLKFGPLRLIRLTSTAELELTGWLSRVRVSLGRGLVGGVRKTLIVDASERVCRFFLAGTGVDVETGRRACQFD